MSEIVKSEPVACLEAHLQYLTRRLATEPSRGLEEDIRYTRSAIDTFQGSSRGFLRRVNAQATLRIAVKTSLHRYRQERTDENQAAVRLGIRALRATGEKIERRVTKEFLRIGNNNH